MTYACPPDCQHCEAIAGARAEDARQPLAEREIRARENAFEAGYWGDR